MYKIETFTHPTMHVLSATKNKLLFTETFGDGRWLDDGQVIFRNEMRLKVVSQHKGVNDYYVWVEEVQ